MPLVPLDVNSFLPKTTRFLGQLCLQHDIYVNHERVQLATRPRHAVVRLALGESHCILVPCVVFVRSEGVFLCQIPLCSFLQHAESLTKMCVNCIVVLFKAECNCMCKKDERKLPK